MVKVFNPSWEDAVRSVCSQVEQVLAPGATKISVELYKLLLYRENDFFHRHQDAQYSASMCATLFFVLPTEHEGGEFSLEDPDCHKK